MSRSAGALKSALKSNNGEQRHREFRQAHWQDHFHEPDGTDPALITTGEADRNIERVRSAVDGLCEPIPQPKKWTAREMAQDMFFRRGENVGAAFLEKHLAAISTRDGHTMCVDDVSGEELSEEGVRAARTLEMDYFIKMGVYSYDTREEATRSSRGKIIKGRWIDVNKGDSKCPDYRSRFVGKEFNTGVDSSLYAATPPQEALKLLLSVAASGRHRAIANNGGNHCEQIA